MITKEIVKEFFENKFSDKNWKGETINLKDDFAILIYSRINSMKKQNAFMAIHFIDGECKDMMLQGTHFFFDDGDNEFQTCMKQAEIEIDHYINHGWWKNEEKYWSEI